MRYLFHFILFYYIIISVIYQYPPIRTYIHTHSSKISVAFSEFLHLSTSNIATIIVYYDLIRDVVVVVVVKKCLRVLLIMFVSVIKICNQCYTCVCWRLVIKLGRKELQICLPVIGNKYYTLNYIIRGIISNRLNNKPSHREATENEE